MRPRTSQTLSALSAAVGMWSATPVGGEGRRGLLPPMAKGHLMFSVARLGPPGTGNRDGYGRAA
jgi:hypothetical protein